MKKSLLKIMSVILAAVLLLCSTAPLSFAVQVADNEAAAESVDADEILDLTGTGDNFWQSLRHFFGLPISLFKEWIRYTLFPWEYFRDLIQTIKFRLTY